MGDSIIYTKETDKYMIRVDANKKTKEIDYIDIYCRTDEDPTNVFMSLTRLNYPGENDDEFTKWLTDNIGKNSTKKIGNANFELAISSEDFPILFMRTDGQSEYSEEQAEIPPQ